jgi:hypothetical protein
MVETEVWECFASISGSQTGDGPVARHEGIPRGVGRPNMRKISHFYVKIQRKYSVIILFSNIFHKHQSEFLIQILKK